jgi:ketosteroid isomerase-like protein
MDAPEDRLSIQRLEDQLRAGMLAGDADALDDLIADDLIFTDHQGHRLGKAQDLDAHRSGALRLDRLDLSDRDIKMLDSAAVVTVRADISGSYEGTPFAGAFAYTRIWSRRAGRWSVAAVHCSAIL